jgi:hypothetical protein
MKPIQPPVLREALLFAVLIAVLFVGIVLQQGDADPELCDVMDVPCTGEPMKGDK